MKRIFFSLLAIIAIVGCNNKNNDDTPTISEQQQNYLPTKKVKNVTCTYIQEVDNANTNSYSGRLENLLNPELMGQKFEQVTMNYLYEYDAAGRINKITVKKEGVPDKVSTFVYTDNSVFITSPIGRTGEDVTIEHGLNAAGNFLSIGMYNEKQQLNNSVYTGVFTWEDDNLTKITSRRENDRGVVKEETTLFTYNNVENKNKIFLLNAGTDGRDGGGYTFQEYFGADIAMLRGAAPKNLPIQITIDDPITPEEIDWVSETEEYPSNISYTFDSEGFVSTISEKIKGRISGGYFTSLSNYSYGNKEATQYWNTLQTLITNIQNGTVTDKSYKLIGETDDKTVFQITVPVKVKQEENGKTIELTVDKVCQYTLRYSTENNKKELSQITVLMTFYANNILHYELNY